MQISVETVSLLSSLEGTITLPDLSTRPLSFTRQNDFTWTAAYTPEVQGDYSVRISVLGAERSAAFTAGLHSIDYPAEVFETIPAIFTVEYKNTGTTPKGAQIALEFKDYFGNTESVENSELQNLAVGAVLTQSFQLSFNSSGLRRVDSTLYVDGGIEEARTFYFNVSSPDTLETTSMQIPSLLTKGEEADWTFWIPIGFFFFINTEHVFDGKRFKIKFVGGVVIGGNSLRIAIDHNGFIACLTNSECRMHAAIIEFNSLSDPVWTSAENHDFFSIAHTDRVRCVIG